MKACVVVGTRPEIIKMSPIIKVLERRREDYFVAHTGQHYSYRMDRLFFKQLELPNPRYNLAVGSGSHAEETARILLGLEKILKEEHPDVVLVEGDTNSVLSASLASSKLMIPVGHIEAGLRSFDRSMPEELNRVVCDHLSTYLFAPTKVARDNLLREGISSGRISITGNTVVDAVTENATMVGQPPLIARAKPSSYFLLTLHRQENVDDPARLAKILKGLGKASGLFGLPVIFPIHPRTRKRIRQFGHKLDKNLRLLEPLGYSSFLALLGSAKAVFTDSGGVQEEACILRVPCVTLRDNTERPETVTAGANIVAGIEAESIVRKARIMLSRPKSWRHPYGDGHAADRIIRVILDNG